jgi:hypothetical protein
MLGLFITQGSYTELSRKDETVINGSCCQAFYVLDVVILIVKKQTRHIRLRASRIEKEHIYRKKMF